MLTILVVASGASQNPGGNIEATKKARHHVNNPV
jgi:hypothetical protein